MDEYNNERGIKQPISFLKEGFSSDSDLLELGKSLIDKHELKLSKSELVMNVVKCCKQFFKSLLAVPVLIFYFCSFNTIIDYLLLKEVDLASEKKLDTKLFQTRRYEFGTNDGC